MGISESKCVNFDGESLYINENYTVIRTNGTTQEGWAISSTPHKCDGLASYSWSPTAHATLSEKGWRVFLGNATTLDHSCGWRPLGTFWPSRLTGNEEAICEWTEAFKSFLEKLAEEKGLPTRYEEHVCHRGAPTYYCGGCMNEKSASEKASKK